MELKIFTKERIFFATSARGGMNCRSGQIVKFVETNFRICPQGQILKFV